MQPRYGGVLKRAIVMWPDVWLADQAAILSSLSVPGSAKESEGRRAALEILNAASLDARSRQKPEAGNPEVIEQIDINVTKNKNS